MSMNTFEADGSDVGKFSPLLSYLKMVWSKHAQRELTLHSKYAEESAKVLCFNALRYCTSADDDFDEVSNALPKLTLNDLIIHLSRHVNMPLANQGISQMEMCCVPYSAGATSDGASSDIATARANPCVIVYYFCSLWLCVKFWWPKVYQLPLSLVLRDAVSRVLTEDSATCAAQYIEEMEEMIKNIEVHLLRCSQHCIPVV